MAATNKCLAQSNKSSPGAGRLKSRFANEGRRRSWLSNLSICRLPFTSACSVEPNNEFLQASFEAIADGGGRCVATLAMLASEANASKTTTRNAIARAVTIGLLVKTERRSYCAVSLPNILTYGKALTAPHLKATHEASPLPRRIVLHANRLNRERALRFSEPNDLGQGVGRAH